MLLRGSSLRVPGGLCGRSPGRPRLLFLGGRDCSTWWGGEEARRAPERAPNSCLAVLGAGGGGGGWCERLQACSSSAPFFWKHS